MDIKDVLVSVIPVVASVIVSVVVSRGGILAQNRNLFGSVLVQKRFDHYSELYSALSSFIKVLEDYPKGNAASISNGTFRQFRKYILDWDSRYSYLMSGECVDQWAEYVWKLEEYSADDLAKDQEQRKKIRIQTGGIETALRSDLGVYSLNMNVFHSNYPPGKISWRRKIDWTFRLWFPWAV